MREERVNPRKHSDKTMDADLSALQTTRMTWTKGGAGLHGNEVG